MLREASKRDTWKSCGANCESKMYFKEALPVSKFKYYFLVKLKVFSTCDVCFAIQIIRLLFQFFCYPIVPLCAQFYTQMLMCWHRAAVLVLQVGRKTSVVVLPFGECGIQ